MGTLPSLLATCSFLSPMRRMQLVSRSARVSPDEFSTTVLVVVTVVAVSLLPHPLAITSVATLVIASGCGSNDTATTVTTTKTVVENSSGLTRADRLTSCIRRIGLKKEHVASNEGRVPIVTVPADYLGSFVSRNRAVL